MDSSEFSQSKSIRWAQVPAMGQTFTQQTGQTGFTLRTRQEFLSSAVSSSIGSDHSRIVWPPPSQQSTILRQLDLNDNDIALTGTLSSELGQLDSFFNMCTKTSGPEPCRRRVSLDCNKYRSSKGVITRKMATPVMMKTRNSYYFWVRTTISPPSRFVWPQFSCAHS